jgi:signal peptidase I
MMITTGDNVKKQKTEEIKAKPKTLKRKKPWLQDWIEAILFAFVVAMVIRNYTFQNFKIPSSSMESTLLIGDYLVANKVKYFFQDPKREDIITFRYPANPPEPEPRDQFVKLLPPLYWNKAEAVNFTPPGITFMHLTYYTKMNIVKRVIAMPGETVEIRNKVVYINGKAFDRPYQQYIDPGIFDQGIVIPEIRDYWIEHKEGWADPDRFMMNRDWFGPVKVPAGHYFVMGDNRDVSADSRYWGFLGREDITGTPAIIFWSRDQETGEYRWDRVFRLVH